MPRFISRRLLESVPLFALLSLLIFALFSLIPGDYLTEMELNPSISSRQVEALRQSYGLDLPFYVQYFKWLTQILQGNLGYSFIQQRPALNLIMDRLGNTLVLTLTAFLMTLVLAVPLAVLSALKAGRWPDRLNLLLSLFGLSLPSVLMGLILLYFAFWSREWLGLPIGGSGEVKHLILPSLTLALPMVAFFFRTLRRELIEALRRPFVLAAVAKGLPRHRVVYHALRNALNPLISISGLALGGLLSGTVVVEKVFNRPGLGSLTVSSILQRDLFVALSCLLVAAVLVVVTNLLADLMLAWNDPRIRQR